MYEVLARIVHQLLKQFVCFTTTKQFLLSMRSHLLISIWLHLLPLLSTTFPLRLLLLIASFINELELLAPFLLLLKQVPAFNLYPSCSFILLLLILL